MGIRIEHITVTRAGALKMAVAVDLDMLTVSERVAELVLRDFPNLTRHVCVNESGETFGDDLVGTWTAHLLEHLAIEIQAASEREAGCEKAGEGLMGHTSWAAELADTRPCGYGLFDVVVTFHDDLVALAAVKHALNIIEHAFAL